MQEQFGDRLAELVEGDHESLLSNLKEMARNTAIDARQSFEQSLLRLAQEITEPDKRSAVYEVLVALQSIWNEHPPEQGLLKKFWASFNAKNYKEAEANYKRLAKQGLDYVGTFETEGGTVIPIITKEKNLLLQFNKKELIFYTLSFDLLAKVRLPKGLEIIDVIAPVFHRLYEDMETILVEELIDELWILFENDEGKQALYSTNVNVRQLDSLQLAVKRIAEDFNYLEERLPCFCQMSYFQKHLLLISKDSIYFQENSKWKEWYSTKSSRNEITAVETTRDGFWVGHSNGDVLILNSLKYVGIRKTFKGFTDAINTILGTERFVLVTSETCLKVSDYVGSPVTKSFIPSNAIRKSAFLNENFVLLLMANGMLIAKDFKQGNISWQMNIGNFSKMLFLFRQYVYCSNEYGQIKVLQLPIFNTMTKSLHDKGIYVDDSSFNIKPQPNTPIMHISNFIGRKNILSDIKNMYNANFLLYGEPRVGKTSLLNALHDTLAEKAKCVVVDMAQLLRRAKSFKDFEDLFIEKCLEQHFMKCSDLPKDKFHFHTIHLMLEKIRGSKTNCVLGMDNFIIPDHFDSKNRESFRLFFLSMICHINTIIIITCLPQQKDEIKTFSRDYEDTSKKRRLITKKIPFFSEIEVKKALRKKHALNQDSIEKIYKYVGRFPHLINLYDSWELKNQTIEEQSVQLAQVYSDNIFEYFRDLSIDARLLIATILHENMEDEKSSFHTFYSKFPFLKSSLPKKELEKAIKEINNYGDGLSAQKDTEAFKITISNNARLFSEAAKYISWIKNFKTIYQFTLTPNEKKAREVAQTFTKITQSSLGSDKSLKDISSSHHDKFFVDKLTNQGLEALRIPLPTFVVISLSTWREEIYTEAFQDLYTDLQEFIRKAGGESENESSGQLFYILLFELHGASKKEVRSTLDGYDRISIIDAQKLKDIIMSKTPKEKATEYIFSQLGIRERSPYTTSGAVPDNLFFGRHMEIALIRGLPENIGIFGIRTIGKTSLLRKLRKAFQKQKQWRVYDMDCSRIEDEKSLLENLAEKICVPCEEIADMEKFRKYITREAETGNHRYLFLLDEVDRLVHYDTGHGEKIFNTFNRLCNETMSNNETAARFILSGFQEMFEQMKNPLSRLYNFMIFMPLKPLDRDSAMRLVTQPIENIQVRWHDKKDAEYLVNNCSRHPRLLQAACHALLAILDDKGEKRDIIERIDVDYALRSDEFREICMRFYQDRSIENRGIEARRTTEKDDTFLKTKWVRGAVENAEALCSSTENSAEVDIRKEFLSDLHRITILTAIQIVFKENKDVFSMADLHGELTRIGIDVTPNVMRNILDRLCLSGNFRLRDETTVLAKNDQNVKIKAYEIDKDNKNEKNDSAITVAQPETYIGTETTFPKFTFEFGVKIFPELLVAHFGGLEKCEEERKKLIERGHWR